MQLSGDPHQRRDWMKDIPLKPAYEHNWNLSATSINKRTTGKGFGASLKAPRWPNAMAMAFMALWFLVAPLSASPQEITVRIINARSGKPLREVPVTMFLWNGPPTFRFDNVPKGEIVVDATTDENGRAVFQSPQPTTEHVGFSVGTPWDFAGCWHLQESSPAKVLQSGVVADYNETKCGKLRQQVLAKPGEVVIVEKKLTSWEKMRRELP